MQKVALVLVLLLVTILATHTQAQTLPQQKTQGKIITNPNKKADAPFKTAQLQSGAYAEISLYDIWFTMLTDNDGDGYYQKFEINFDLDTPYNAFDIYVVGKLGEQILFQTDAFTLNNNSANDSYQTTVLLTQGYASAWYPLSLTVYDAQTQQPVAEFNTNNNELFTDLYLEDATADNQAAQSVSMYNLAYQLSEDWDNDGYFTQIAVEFDVDAPNQTRWIYAEVFLVDAYDHWHEIIRTQPFQIQHYNDSDRYQSTLTLDYGFDPQAYQLAVRVYDANNHNPILTSKSPNGTYANMESQNWDDDYLNQDSTNEDGVIVEEEYYYSSSGSGGSLNISLLIAMGLFAHALKRRSSRKVQL